MTRRPSSSLPTGFALLGHLLEICRGSCLSAEIRYADLPVLPAVLQLAQQGYATGAADRNWNSYGVEVDLPQDFSEWQRKLLYDPQTSGGLLVACAPQAADCAGRIPRHRFRGGMRHRRN
jgi:selenide,water dikinase